MIEAGEFSLDARPVDVAEEVRRRTELLCPMAERKGLAFTVDAPEEGPEAEVDPNGLDRILTNLVTNAIKFTEEGGVTVRVSGEPSHVVLAVADTGIGISEDFLPELFEAFKQESEGLQREHEGTGLGLSIAKELVDLMDGTITVDSQKGEGTTFTVRLPYRADETR
jgi:signal transduction histidine kinase